MFRLIFFSPYLSLSLALSVFAGVLVDCSSSMSNSMAVWAKTLTFSRWILIDAITSDRRSLVKMCECLCLSSVYLCVCVCLFELCGDRVNNFERNAFIISVKIDQIQEKRLSVDQTKATVLRSRNHAATRARSHQFRFIKQKNKKNAVFGVFYSFRRSLIICGENRKR